MLREFKNISKSNLGNFIQHEAKLSNKDDFGEKYHINDSCFIENGCVLIDTMVYEDIPFCTNICVYDSAQIYCVFPVFSFVYVYSNAQIYGYGGAVLGCIFATKIKIYLLV
ncbi:hypothetical protein [Bartonella acomydis]|uniref:hypothetical protein n=1 Tax=Bartonella acomydis TaxID=686234 RepID=UPI0031E5D9C5